MASCRRRARICAQDSKQACEGRRQTRAPYDPQEARRALRNYFGHADFRAGQEDVVRAVLNGEDVFALAPTGAGKSLAYQLPAVMGHAPVLVVSPLVSLMRDQIEALRARGIPAGSLNSVNEPQENAVTRDLIAQRRLRLLYVAPERLVLDETIAMLRSFRPKLLAVDEAHCVSRWGHDFRPDYAHLAGIARKLGAPQTIAVTATASPQTRADIQALLFLREPKLFVSSFQRPNIDIAFRRKRNRLVDVASVLRAYHGQCGIVYCASRQATDELAHALQGLGAPALAYHAGLDSATRSAHQDQFIRRKDAVMVATIAFGMGIDRADVRYVLHADLPHSVEAYYQEIGRAGRDGAPSRAIAFASRHMGAAREGAFGEAQASRDMRDLAQGYDCRWRVVLAHLGESGAPCGHCDNCRSRRRLLAPPQRAWRAATRWLENRAARNAPSAPEDAPVASAWTQVNEGEPAAPVARMRLLVVLKEERAAIARRQRIAPVAIADDAALRALSLLALDDADAMKRAAADILADFDAAATPLIATTLSFLRAD
ncbi:MAG: ATP-dependent DNA helicase RecQ [Hyphomicrobiales bacterium]|nr:ATP-dependent DNA helicase RecQ [Hyphomicrobiales bacterium]